LITKGQLGENNKRLQIKNGRFLFSVAIFCA